MMEWLRDLFMGVVTNRWLAFLLYWLPLVLCAIGYFLRTWHNYQKDIRDRAECENKDDKTKCTYYSPTDTIGSLIGRAIVTILPIGNLFAAVFDVAPGLFGKFFDWIGEVFNQPLVPQRKKSK